MKTMTIGSFALVLSIALAGCGSTDSAGIVEDPDFGALKKDAGGSCPAFVSCPGSLPGYPTFMYAINAPGGPIACWYTNGTSQSHVDESVPASCPVCRAPGQSDPHYFEQWFASDWTCTAS